MEEPKEATQVFSHFGYYVQLHTYLMLINIDSILDEDDTVHKEFEEKEVMSDGWFDAPEHYANKSLDQLRAMPVCLYLK